MNKKKKRDSNANDTGFGFKSIAAVLSVLFLLYIFTFYVDGEMGAILAAFLGAAPIVSLFFAVYARKRVEVSMHCDGYVKKGTSLKVTVRLEKTGSFPLGIIELTAHATEVFEEGDKVFKISMLGKDEAEFTFDIKAETGGNGGISIGSAYSCGFLGFVKLSLPQEMPIYQSVGVIPEIPDVRSSSQLFRNIADIVMTSDDDEDNDTSMQFSANSFPGYEHREYVQGDPLKRVNWKLSTKKDKLMVRLDEAVASVQPVIVLDLYRKEGVNVRESILTEEKIIQAVFGLMELMVKQGIACSFVYTGPDGTSIKENVDNPDYPQQLMLRVLAAKVLTGKRTELAGAADSVCACVIASTSFGGDISVITDSVEDTDNISLIGASPESENSTSMPLWYLDADNSFRQV